LWKLGEKQGHENRRMTTREVEEKGKRGSSKRIRAQWRGKYK
jgi:hypothetical protein